MLGPYSINYGDPINQSSQFAPGLVGWWKVLPNLTSAVMFRDLRRTSNATAAGTVALRGSLGLPGSYGSIELNGGYYTFTLPPSIDGTANTVLAGWFLPTTTVTQWSQLIGTRGSNRVPTILLNGISGNVGYMFDNDEWSVNTGMPAVVGEWNWVAYSSYAAGSYMALWNKTNGWQTYSDANSNSAGNIPSGSWTLGIDHGYIPSGRNFVGHIDDISLRIGVTYELTRLRSLFDESRRGHPTLLNRVQKVPFFQPAAGSSFQAAWARNCNSLVGA